MHAVGHLRIVTGTLSLVILLLWMAMVRLACPPQPKLLVVCVDDVGRAEAVAYETMEALNVRAVGPDPVVHRRGAWKQSSLERSVVQSGRQRPAESALRRPLQIAIDRPHATAHACATAWSDSPCSCLSRKTSRIFLISSLRAGIASPLLSKEQEHARSGYRRAFTIPGTAVPLPPESLFHFLRNRCSTSSGIRTRGSDAVDKMFRQKTCRHCI